MLEHSFVVLEEEFVFSEDVQNFSDYSTVLFQVLGEDEDVINVYTYDAPDETMLSLSTYFCIFYKN
jgi:hypothetical protein